MTHFAIFRQTSTSFQIFILLFLIVFFALLSILLALLASTLIYDIPMTEMANMATTENGLSAASTIQMISQICVFVLPPVALALLISDNPLPWLGIGKKPTLPLLFMAVVVMFSILPLIQQLSTWNEAIKLPDFLESIEQWMLEKEHQAEEISLKFLEVSSIRGLLLNMVMIGILPAVGEELLFRAALQPLLGKMLKNVHFGIILSAILFSIMHLQFYGFIPRFGLGLLLGYFYLWSGSILVPMLMHFVNNASAVFVFYLSHNGYVDIKADEFGSTNNLFVLVISILISGGLIYLSYNRKTATN
ncbi:MAG: CPBP family intramembrane metalloprotease [Bacteroidales bacterium]|nr:CPBP family intramembrane metalloprotease [Bacteroidales bacterium]